MKNRIAVCLFSILACALPLRPQTCQPARVDCFTCWTGPCVTGNSAYASVLYLYGFTIDGCTLLDVCPDFFCDSVEIDYEYTNCDGVHVTGTAYGCCEMA